MAIVKYGTITATGSAYNLNLGFVPNHFRVVNNTALDAGTGVAISEYFSQMPNGAAYIQTLTAGAPVITRISSDGYTPYQTPDSSLWTSTNLTITDISQAANASITATHAFTAADIGLTVVTISGVVGMIQINTLRGVIQSVTGTSSFTVNIDSTAFSSYVSGGIANIITGVPAVTYYPVTGPLATPQYNKGQIGLTLGSSVCGSASDVLYWEAVLDTPVTS